MPFWARNKETGAQLGNARASFGVSWKSILAIVVLIVAFCVILVLLG